MWPYDSCYSNMSHFKKVDYKDMNDFRVIHHILQKLTQRAFDSLLIDYVTRFCCKNRFSSKRREKRERKRVPLTLV